MKTKTTTVVALAFSALLLVPVSSAAAEFAERFVVSLAGFQPDGPAPFGAMVGINYGGRVSDSLRIGAEVGWYRRSYESQFLFVEDPDAGTGLLVASVTTAHIFPILGTADYFIPMGDGATEFHIGAGLGIDYVRIEHHPLSIRSFTRSATPFSYTVRAGVSKRPGNSNGSVYLEGFYKGSTLDDEDDLSAGQGADVETRSSGFGVRIGFRF